MRAFRHRLLALIGAGGLLAVPMHGFCGTIPYAESFESYTNGQPISSVAGWTADTNVLVSTNAAAIAALATYTNAGNAFPLTGSHTNVLELGGWTTNALLSATGGVVVADVLVLATRRDWPPADDTNMQMAVFVSTNGFLTIWHQNRTNTAVNEWMELTNCPVLDSNAWSRISIREDQAVGMFQVSVNGAAPLVDPSGWTSTNGTRPGSWFYMVQTNRAMAQFSTVGEVKSYMDDLVVTTRGITYSSNGFAEASANDGTIDNTNPMKINLAWDTFAGTNGENFASNTDKLFVTNMPPGLAVSALYSTANPTQLTVTVTGQDNNNEAANSVSNLTFSFGSAAFTLGKSWDVAGATNTHLVVQFQSSSQPVLTYNNTTFVERQQNDGGVNGSAVLTLGVKTFAGTNGQDLAASGAVTSPNLPGGLVLSVVGDGAQHATMSFGGRATNNTAANSLTNLAIVFNDAAFVGGGASTVSNAMRSDLYITFNDPRVVTASPSGFNEAVANDGSIGNSVTLTLAGDEPFTNAVFGEGTNYTVSGVPTGLVFSLTRSSSTQLVVSLTGQAAAHASGNSTSIVFTLLDAAFQTVAASNITGSSQLLGVTFADPPLLAYSGLSFMEAVANNGTVSDTVTITLTGDTFTNTAFTADTQYTFSNVPLGLTGLVTRTSGNQAVISLTGKALFHTPSENTTFSLAFYDVAFTHVAVSNITDNQKSFSIGYRDQPTLTCDSSTFTERADYSGAISNTVSIMLAGDSFAAGPLLQNVHYTVTGVPPGLSVYLARSSGGLLIASLSGFATAHASTNSTTFGITFLNPAFQNVAAGDIIPSSLSFNVNFFDVPPANSLPFTDDFEAYSDGLVVDGTNGWTGLTPGSAVVTADALVASVEAAYTGKFPLVTAHTKVLRLTGGVTSSTRGGADSKVFVDFMGQVDGRDDAPVVGPTDQMGLYVNTNQHPVIWRYDTVTASNVWTVLTNSIVTTGTWHRVTVYQDYKQGMFNVKVDSQAISNESGVWFNMVQTNRYISQVVFDGGSWLMPIYIDDVSITVDPWIGSVYLIR